MVIFHRFLYVYQRVTGPNWAVGEHPLGLAGPRWSLRDIGRVMQGLTLALENPNFATADLHRLWIHEVSRVFEDQLQMSIHKQLFQVGWWGWMFDGFWMDFGWVCWINLNDRSQFFDPFFYMKRFQKKWCWLIWMWIPSFEQINWW